MVGYKASGMERRPVWYFQTGWSGILECLRNTLRRCQKMWMLFKANKQKIYTGARVDTGHVSQWVHKWHHATWGVQPIHTRSCWTWDEVVLLHTYLRRIARQNRSCVLRIPLAPRKVVWMKAHVEIPVLHLWKLLRTVPLGWLWICNWITQSQPVLHTYRMKTAHQWALVAMATYGHLGKPHLGKSVDIRPLALVDLDS